jgi:hypothetical protein
MCVSLSFLLISLFFHVVTGALGLDDNKLAGTLPNSIANLKKLSELVVQLKYMYKYAAAPHIYISIRCAIDSCNIRSFFSQFIQTTVVLYLDGNDFSGTIPHLLAALTDLSKFLMFSAWERIMYDFRLCGYLFCMPHIILLRFILHQSVDLRLRKNSVS